MNILRTAPVKRIAAARRLIHSTSRLSVNIGDKVPDVEVHEDSPGNKFSIARELQGKGKALIVGVPAAFSPTCSASHIPGYVEKRPALPSSVFVVAVNDAFVTKAWKNSIPGAKESGIRFVADPSGNFNKELDLLFDSTALFGNKRSKRYALIIEDGKVSKAFVEPDNTGLDVSAVDNVLVQL